MRRRISVDICSAALPLFLAAALLFAAGSSLAAQRAPTVPPRPSRHPTNSETFERTLPLHAGGSFSLSNVNGSVEVEGWEREEVQISAVKTSMRSAANLSSVRIEAGAGPAGVIVRTRYPEGEGVEVSVDYRIRVPRQVRLATVSTVNGALRVRGVEGEGVLRTVNGNVELHDGAGHFDAYATNGNIYLELLELEFAPEGPGSFLGSAMTVATVNGSVVLALPADADSELDVRTMNGDFFSELPLVRHSASRGREVRGRLGEGGGLLKLRTMNGAIRLLISRRIV